MEYNAANHDMVSDYQNRSYLSVAEVAAHTGMEVKALHRLVKAGELPATKSAGGQYRFRLDEIRHLKRPVPVAAARRKRAAAKADAVRDIHVLNTRQRLLVADARNLAAIADDSVHLAITSPPYFNAKMYSETGKDDLGNIHDLPDWLAHIQQAWKEVWRALQPGRKFFVNIMNLPLRENNTYRSVNLVGKTIDLCEEAGFVFKRDIIWHKTNGVKAHFGTYPYPGGILLNNMHESILEFQKPAAAAKAAKKYAHVTAEQREASKLGKDFWLQLKNSDVWLMTPEKSGGGRAHAAPFPLELPERLIRAYSYVGETVLDPFVGSGTTAVAAAQHGRNGVGADINPAFITAAEQRLRALGELL